MFIHLLQILTPEALDRMINLAHRVEDIAEDALNHRPAAPSGPPALAPQPQDDGGEALDNFQMNE